MSGRLWKAYLNFQSPRLATWVRILGDRYAQVPLCDPKIVRAKLGETEAEVYQLDVEKLSPAQRGKLIAWISETFGDPIDEVQAELERNGFPIRAEDVVVEFSLRAFI